MLNQARQKAQSLHGTLAAVAVPRWTALWARSMAIGHGISAMSPSERHEEEAVPLAAPRIGAFEQEWLLLDPGQEEEDEQHHRPPMWAWALLVAAVRPPPPPPACRRPCQLAAAATGLCVLHHPTAVDPCHPPVHRRSSPCRRQPLCLQ